MDAGSVDQSVSLLIGAALHLLCQGSQEVPKTGVEHARWAALMIPIDDLPQRVARCRGQIQAREIARPASVQANSGESG